MSSTALVHPPQSMITTSGYRLVSAGPQLWRVIDRAGTIIGHLAAYRLGDAVRYRARRYHAATRILRDLGEFWSPEDALDCLRYSR
ncbi:hypothetical protein ACFQZV_08785 [Microbacterium koreense]|uniref:DNA mismatch repair protein n=1 Tax=Microbacterium koreense TaxID=323761 RepID=A0ABW2ZRX4_9MICO